MYFGENASSFALTVLTINEEFPLGIQNSVFKNWQKKDIRLIRYVCQGNILMSFQQIQQKHNIPSEHFYGYLQPCTFMLSKVKNLQTDTTPIGNIDLYMINQKDTRHSLSYSYSVLYSLDPTDVGNVIRKWECDLDEQFIDDDWLEAIASVKKHICLQPNE